MYWVKHVSYALVGLAFLGGGSSAFAASLQVTEYVGGSTSGKDYVLFDLLPGSDLDGFDTIEITITAAGALLADGDTEASLLTPGEDETSFNAFLTAPPLFGGYGLSEFGYTETVNGLAGTYASLGSNSISSEDLFLGQVTLTQELASTNGEISVRFFDDGQELGTLTDVFGVPEPASLGFIVVGGVGLLGRRRRA